MQNKIQSLYGIHFSHISNHEFQGLKQHFSFQVISRLPGFAGDGEAIFTGTSVAGQECLLFEYADSTDKVSFLISPDGKNVNYTFTGAASSQTVQSLIRGSITKYCLQQQGYFCLHAAGLNIGGEVILFIGQKTAGKSTLSAYFHLQGHPVWCDDYAVLQPQPNSFNVRQGDVSLKITQNTVNALNIPAANLKSVFTYADGYALEGSGRHIEGKYYFTQVPTPASATTLPLAAVFLLQPRQEKPVALISRPLQAEAFTLLMNEMMLPGISPKAYVRLYFQSLKTLLEVTPVYNIHAPDDITRLPEVYEAILKTTANARRASS